MIISASRRTDIPNYYSDWFFNRVSEGYAMVRNPFRYRQVMRVGLTPPEVDGIVFWSKNPEPMLCRLPELRAYAYYFQFTLNGYGQILEPAVPEVRCVLDTFRRAADILGPKRVLWRYDPILLSQDFTIGWHEENFYRLCRSLSGYTERCTVSLMDLYPRMGTFLARTGTRCPENEEVLRIAECFREIAARFRIGLAACCEPELFRLGISQAACVDAGLLERISGREIAVVRDSGQRKGCGCAASADLGVYRTCRNRCGYCYAGSGSGKSHDPVSPLLLGRPEPEDRIVKP